MPLSYSEDAGNLLIEIRISGQVSQSDYAAVLPEVGAFVARHGSARVMEVVESFAGFDGEIRPDSSPEGMALLSRITHLALISDIGWFCPMLSSVAPGASTKIRSFSLSEHDEARAWLTQDRRREEWVRGT